MKMTMTAGAIAIAASTDGANEPTAKPKAEEAMDSTVRIARNLRNLPGAGLRPHSLYIIEPARHGNKAASGSSANSFETK